MSRRSLYRSPWEKEYANSERRKEPKRPLRNWNRR